MSATLSAIQSYQRVGAAEVALAKAATPEAAPRIGATRMPPWPPEEQAVAVQANQIQAAGEVSSMVVTRAQQVYAMQAAG